MSSRVHRSWAASAVAAGLVVTAAGLWVLLPSEAVVGNWALAWAGFDAGVAAVALVTAVLLRRGDRRAAVSAAAGAALLVADAWFDVTTSAGAGTVVAVAMAVLVELPLAAAGLLLALRLLRPGTDAPARGHEEGHDPVPHPSSVGTLVLCR